MMASQYKTTRNRSTIRAGVQVSVACTIAIGLAVESAPLIAQDTNVLFAADSVESLLLAPELRIIPEVLGDWIHIPTATRAVCLQQIISIHFTGIMCRIQYSSALSAG